MFSFFFFKSSYIYNITYYFLLFFFFFFFKQKTAYEIRPCDGVQTCALPISRREPRGGSSRAGTSDRAPVASPRSSRRCRAGRRSGRSSGRRSAAVCTLRLVWGVARRGLVPRRQPAPPPPGRIGSRPLLPTDRPALPTGGPRRHAPGGRGRRCARRGRGSFAPRRRG